MNVKLEKINPFVRAAELQRAVLEGDSLRMAYDNRLFCVLEHSGVFILQDEEFTVSEGSVIYIPPAVGYCFRGKIRVAVINFDMTRGCDQRKKPICPPPMRFFDKSQLFDTSVAEGFEKPLIIDNGEFLIPEVKDIVTSFNRQDDYADAQTSAQLKTVLARLLRHIDDRSRPESRLASRIEGYIRMYATEIEGNDSIARRFGYHPVYIASVFKEETGKTLHSAIIDERLKTACRWLTQTNASIDEIAADTGFSSRSHFCTVFKARLGMSPGKWRSQINR